MNNYLLNAKGFTDNLSIFFPYDFEIINSSHVLIWLRNLIWGFCGNPSWLGWNQDLLDSQSDPITIGLRQSLPRWFPPTHQKQNLASLFEARRCLMRNLGGKIYIMNFIIKIYIYNQNQNLSRCLQSSPLENPFHRLKCNSKTHP